MTKWTEEQYQELSRMVAEKFSIKPNSGVEYVNEHGQKLGEYKYSGTWLHNDWHQIMELCVKYKVEASQDNEAKRGYLSHGILLQNGGNNKQRVSVVVRADHNNDPNLTERVARMLALMEVIV